MNNKHIVTCSALCLCLLLAGAAAAEDIVANSASISFPTKDAAAGTLTVSGPEGFTFTQKFQGKTPSISLFDKTGYALLDGLYKWEIRPRADAADGEREAYVKSLEAISGVFTIEGGAVVDSGIHETLDAKAVHEGIAEKAQVFATDLVVQGSGCIGFDCTSSESFGFDTLRLKENNLRIHFNDTSASASFPGNDWRLTANDSSNGGANYFAIEDATAGRTPFKVEAGSIANALYVDSEGDIGVGTSTPVVEVHAVDGNSPTFRLEQDGSNGFTPQTWDLAGNETNFFIRDVTNSSKLPFRIKPGAPTDALFIAADGDVGLGTDSPDSELHVQASSTSATSMLHLENKTGPPYLAMTNASQEWRLQVRSDNSIVLFDVADSAIEYEFENDGDMVITGNYYSVACDQSTNMPCAPDYVFEEDYDLLPLDEVADYIEKENHLPNVPSALELMGPVNLTQMQMKLLEKIEELTLYTLDQHETIKNLNTRLAELEKAGAEALK